MFKTEFGSRKDEYIELWIFGGHTKQTCVLYIFAPLDGFLFTDLQFFKLKHSFHHCTLGLHGQMGTFN